MIATAPRFWDHIRRSGLLEADQIDDLEQRFHLATSTEEIAATLIDEGLLTPFQARRIASGDAQHLVLGQYRLVDMLGRGGFGCVYKAVHAFMNRTVAIKVISPEFAEDSRARTWFQREIQAVTQFCHPNIVMAYDANEIDGQCFMVMEFVDGVNLDTLVRQQGPLSARVAADMLLQAAKGLQYAHEKGIVHRDIKPANLLVPLSAGENGRGEEMAETRTEALVKIADFGLARLFNNPGNTLVLRHERSFVGTPDFIAPEQARKVHEADIRSDLYSLGCTFYFALTGQRPFPGESALETIMMHMETEARPLRQVRSDIPPALASAVHKLMAKDPARRFQTPAELAAALSMPAAGDWTAKPAKPMPRIDAQAAPTIAVAAKEFAAAAARSNNDYLELDVRLPAATGQSKDENISEVELVDARLRFLEAWPRWASVVETLATGSAARLGMRQYRALYNDLLSAARLLKTDSKDVYARAEALVQPWLSAQNLAAADRQTLQSVHQRASDISRQLGLERGKTWPWLIAGALFAAVFAGCLLQAFDWNRLPQFRELVQIIEANPIVSLALVVPITVLTAILALTKFLRRY